MDTRLLSAPTLLDWASSSDDDDDDDDVSLLPSRETAESTAVVREQSLHETAAAGEEDAVVGGEEVTLTTGGEEEDTVVGGEEEVEDTLIAAGMEDVPWEHDYHHEETIERCGEDYSLEDYFESIELSHPGYAAHRKELPKAVFRK